METITVNINGFQYSYSKDDLLKIPYFQNLEKYNKDFQSGKEIKIYNQSISPDSLSDLIDYINGNNRSQDLFNPERVRIASNFYGYNLLDDKRYQELANQLNRIYRKEDTNRLFM